MRTITDHKLNGLNDAIDITVLDEPGPGGANHVYKLDLVGGAPDSGGMTTEIRFQKGPIKENGFNGWSNESLAAILIDRMRGFQGEEPTHPSLRNLDPIDAANQLRAIAPFTCYDNEQALRHFQAGLMWLQKRTRDRLARGVEGTSAR